jgi:chromosome segregation ATPase
MEEDTLRGQIKEMEKEFTDVEAMKYPEKKPQGSEDNRKDAEAAFHGQIEKSDKKLIEKETDNKNLDLTLHGRIERLEKQMQETVAEKKRLKTALKKKYKYLATLDFELRELRECIQEIDSVKKELESLRHDDSKTYNMHLQTNLKDRAYLYSMCKEHRKMLQETNGAIEELEASLHRQHGELCVVRLQKESLNRRIQELENKKQIKELNNKEVESSVCSNVKKVAAVSLVVGVVAAAAGWWIFSK